MFMTIGSQHLKINLKASQSLTFKRLLTNYESRTTKVRSSHSQVLDTKLDLKDFAIFTGKYLR